MKKTGLLLLILATTASAYFISEDIDSVAQKYKGFDEILVNITVVDYHNQSYYLVDYTKDLRYSGSIVLDNNGKPVTDKKILRSFALATILHTSYPPESAEMWSELSKNYYRIAPELPENLSGDCHEIASLFKETGNHFSSAIRSYSPEMAEAYLDAEDLLIKKMQDARKKIDGLSLRESHSSYVDEYIESLDALIDDLSANRKGLLQATDYLAETSYDKVTGEERRPQAENDLVLLFTGLMVFVVILSALKKIRR